MKIYYWCPYLTNIATINAVKRSAISIKKYSKKKPDVSILDSSGEWLFFKNNSFGIKILSTLKNINLHKYLPKQGFIFSRISFLIIFIINFFPLIYKIKKNKPNYLIIHLLTFLPIILSPLLSKNTKIILRISGYPEMTIFRKILWKYFSKYLHIVTAPTKLTMDYLVENKIFEKQKIKILKDPIIVVNEINKKKNLVDNNTIIKKEFYVAIGRLTNQKNFGFLIDAFSRNINKIRIKKLYIIGEGECFNNLKKKLIKNKMENNIFLTGFKKNVYKIINDSSGLISVASYEDPGFALIEGAFLRKKIISSLVKNGPLEMNEFGNTGYFFKYNNEDDFIKNIIESENSNNFNKLKNALKFSKEYSVFEHFKKLDRILI